MRRLLRKASRRTPRPSASLAIGLLAVVLTASPALAGKKSCLTGDAVYSGGDAAALGAFASVAGIACPCATFDGSKGKNHAKYVACVRGVVKDAVAAGDLRKECKSIAAKHFAQSTCGFSERRQAGVCIKRNEKTQSVSCTIKLLVKSDGTTPTNACGSKPGKYSQAVCPGVARCIDAADTNGDLLITAADSGSCAGASSEEEQASPVSLVLVSPAETSFVGVSSMVELAAQGGTLRSSADAVTVLVNSRALPAAQISLTPTALVVLDALGDGRNDIEIYATDDAGRPIFASITMWAGENTLPVRVVDESGAPVGTASLTVRLSDDPDVKIETVAPGGIAAISGVPTRTVIVEAVSPQGLGSNATVGGMGTLTIVVRHERESSEIDNNDFSLGLAGWDVGTATAYVVSHQEMLAASTPRALSTIQADDFDLVLDTDGKEGPSTISRTFDAGPEATQVCVRYRFITSEVPGGYFGSEYNDYFSVILRGASGQVFESNSMNGLGLASFDENGATEWRETQLAVSGGKVQVDVTVANVGDDLLDSQVVVDLVEQDCLAITALSLRDIDNGALSHLSAAPHAYFNGVTRVHGTIRINGREDDEIQSVVLEVLQGGGVVATAALADAARSDLLAVIGADKKVEVSTVGRLFDLIPSGIDVSSNGSVRLRARAVTTDGRQAVREYGLVAILDRYTGTNRYGSGRDEAQGGDDWVKPRVRDVIAGLGNTWGDMSNMNGGPFPPHASHRTGNDVDGYFPGYEARNAAVANTLIGQLNSPAGPRIAAVFVTFASDATNPFFAAIQNVTLADGRRATDVIRPMSGHSTHFHYRITD